MTDSAFEINSSGGLGRHPISRMGNVVHNAFRDDTQISINKDAVRNKTNKYPGPVTDETVSIYPREPVFAVRSKRKRRSNHDSVFVMSTVNGLGNSKDPLWKIIQNHTILGVAATRSKADSTNQSPEQDVVVQSGGLTTMVNTGPKRINNGDYVYIEFPNPDIPFERSVWRKGSERQLLWTMPYEPNLDSVTKSGIVELIQDKEQLDEYEKEKRQPIINSADCFRKAFLMGMLEGAHMVFDTGLGKFDKRLLENNEAGYAARLQTSKHYNKKDNRELFLQNMKKHLGLKDTNDNEPNSSDDTLTVPHPSGPGMSQRGSLLEYAIKTVIGRDDNYHLCKRDPGAQEIPSGYRGDLIRRQCSLIDHLFYGVNHGTHFVKNRVIGKAITPADPGAEFDIILMRYG